MKGGAVIGPPWRVIEQPDPSSVFAVDAPDLVGCGVFAAFVPARGELVRAGTEDEAVVRALALARKHDSEAWVLKGALGLRSGQWLFPGPPHMVEITKGPSPQSRAGLAVFTDRLQQRLRRAATPAEAAALEAVFEALGVDWSALTPDQADAIVAGSADIIAAVGADARLIGGARVALSGTAVEVARGTRAALAGRGVLRASGINSSLALQDRRAIQRMARGRVGFFTDEYGRRSARFDQEARRIVNAGLAAGLDPRTIAGDLRSMARQHVTGRSENYYRVVAASMVSQARSFGQATGYRDAGITSYTWEAMLDERTCDICRYMHGQVFQVDDAMSRFDAAERAATPEEAANATPWYGVRSNPDGSRSIFITPRGEPPTMRVANIIQSAVGQVDRTGQHQRLINPRDVGGSVMPPAHGGCRCTTVPVFD